MRRNFALLLCATVLPVAKAPLLAQAGVPIQPDATGAPSDATNARATTAAGTTASPDAGLNEIVVTAQRRSESLLSVPLSIQASTGTQLQTQGIRQITDLQLVTPGYNVSDDGGYSQIFIRGIGNSIFVGADPSVATFIDDVPRIYGSLVSDFVDVERVEVLKGAQGGLYGRNATGGVLNIVTRQPSTSEIKGEFRGSYGTRDTLQVAGYLNVPITDKVALMIGGIRKSHNAYVRNIAPADPYTAANFPNGGRGSFIPSIATLSPQQTANFFNSGVDNRGLQNQNFWATDAKLLLQTTDDLKITLAGDYNHKDDRAGNGVYNTTPAYQQASLQGTFQSLGITAVLPPGFLISRDGKFTAANGTAGFSRLTDYGGSATVAWHLPGVDLTSISAYRRQKTDFFNELNSSSVPFLAAHVTLPKHYFYQELRAISSFEEPLRLIGGATYLKTSVRAASDFTELDPLIQAVPIARSSDAVRNYSVYAQASYDLTRALTLTASGRYVHENNDALSQLSGTPSSLVEHKFLPSATLSYKLDGGGTIYARWARGFKSGGINPVADLASFGTRPDLGGIFQGETVDTYEVGLRRSLFNRDVQLTTAFFYNDYRNLQTLAHANAAHAATILEAIINAGTARSYGVEGSVTWRVVKPLVMTVAAGYLDAKYKNFQNTDATLLVPFDLSGTRLPYAPKFQFSYNANLNLPVTKAFNLIGNVLVSHNSRTLFLPSGDPGVLPPSEGKAYWLTNLRIGARTADDKYELALFANNLFNTQYYVYGNSAAGNGNILNYGNPRVVGVELVARY